MADRAGLRGRFSALGAPSPCNIGFDAAPAVAKRDRRLPEGCLCNFRSNGEESNRGDDASPLCCSAMAGRIPRTDAVESGDRERLGFFLGPREKEGESSSERRGDADSYN
jgi:hypothetical protein